MKFSLAWLKDHLETTADRSTQIAEKLNVASGWRVEGVEDAGGRSSSAFRVARVLTAEKHPAGRQAASAVGRRRCRHQWR